MSPVERQGLVDHRLRRAGIAVEPCDATDCQAAMAASESRGVLAVIGRAAAGPAAAVPGSAAPAAEGVMTGPSARIGNSSSVRAGSPSFASAR